MLVLVVLLVLVVVGEAVFIRDSITNEDPTNAYQRQWRRRLYLHVMKRRKVVADCIFN